MATKKEATTITTEEPVNKQERETTMMFVDKIDHAIVNDLDWVETTPELVHYYNKRGLGPNDYFIYKGIKVCEYGKSEACQAKIDADMNRLMHGAKEAKFEGRA